MARSSTAAKQRKPRADALANRKRLIEVAKSAFLARGEAVSLDDVAREAGLGIGTLYRHFPTRDALIEAVYRTEVERLAAAAASLAAAHSPIEALRAWMLLFVDYIAAKKLIAPALIAIVGDPSSIYAAGGEITAAALNALAARAVASGDLRADLDPFDLLRAVAGVAQHAASANWEASARRLVDILLAGARPPQ